jgi:hypothetical protein
MISYSKIVITDHWIFRRVFIMNGYLDINALDRFEVVHFTERQPFPWFNFSGLLHQEAFEKLYREFPSLTLFEKHISLERVGGQRPHDRYYLAYGHSIYGQKNADEPGVVRDVDLPLAWREFMTELQTSDRYRAFMERLLGRQGMTVRYAWHVGFTGSEVSPHRDADNKVGTHIFYFNTHEDWDSDWGGATLVLEGKKTDAINPDFTDFAREAASEIRDNHSFLFQNTPNAWHGVRTLTCPEGRYRRLFNVIFEEQEPKSERISLSSRLRSLFGVAKE